ncbi:hypothetical protein LINPERHAP2_LOCUS23193 [Linum perenne]
MQGLRGLSSRGLEATSGSVWIAAFAMINGSSSFPRLLPSTLRGSNLITARSLSGPPTRRPRFVLFGHFVLTQPGLVMMILNLCLIEAGKPERTSVFLCRCSRKIVKNGTRTSLAIFLSASVRSPTASVGLNRRMPESATRVSSQRNWKSVRSLKKLFGKRRCFGSRKRGFSGLSTAIRTPDSSIFLLFVAGLLTASRV